MIHGDGQIASSLDILLLDAIKKIKNKSTQEDHVEKEFVEFMQAMTIEYGRRINQKILTKDELDSLYDYSFSQVINLALISLTSKNRIHELPYL